MEMGFSMTLGLELGTSEGLLTFGCLAGESLGAHGVHGSLLLSEDLLLIGVGLIHLGLGNCLPG